MSLFQCDKCGCLENTSCTRGYWSTTFLERCPEAYQSYRDVLGLKEGEEYGKYCSACTPQWFTHDGEYGVGIPKEGEEKPKSRLDSPYGQWHERFKRTYFRRGLFHTNEDGNLAHIRNFRTEVDQYKLDVPDTGPALPRPYGSMRVPTPGRSEARYIKRWKQLLKDHNIDRDEE